MVTNLRIPTYVNAVELAAFIMEKRAGERIEYTETTSPTVFEINDRLLAAEASVNKLMNSSWRPDRDTYETIWSKYRHPYTGYRSGWYDKVNYPPALTLVFHPIISVEKLEIIIGTDFVDLVASADYEEGYDKAYYIDKRNGVILFKTVRPDFWTPIRIVYTHGRREHEDGYVVFDGTVGTITISTETSFTSVGISDRHKYNGKLMKMTSGNAVDEVYRVYESDFVGSNTIITVLDGYTMYTDGVRDGDTYEIYAIPHDVQEMIKIYTYLGILVADPTYQHNFTNPYDDPSPQYSQFQWLAGRFSTLLDQRKSTIQLIS